MSMCCILFLRNTNFASCDPGHLKGEDKDKKKTQWQQARYKGETPWSMTDPEHKKKTKDRDKNNEYYKYKDEDKDRQR